MGFVRNYDIVKERWDQVDDILLLHPTVIEEEYAKIEKKSPFYMVDMDGKACSVFLPNKEMREMGYTSDMKNYIPEDTLIPIGGVEGRFALKIIRDLRDKTFCSLGRVRGYIIIDRESGKDLIDFGQRLRYLGRSGAFVDNVLVTKRAIIPRGNGKTWLLENGYVVLDGVCNTKWNNHIYCLYDNEGNFVTTEFDHNTAIKMAASASDLDAVSYPKDGALFGRMIVTSLRDALGEKLALCESDNLVDIANYLQESDIQVAVDLDSLVVYKVNYDKYFRRCESRQDKGTVFVKK